MQEAGGEREALHVSELCWVPMGEGSITAPDRPQVEPRSRQGAGSERCDTSRAPAWARGAKRSGPVSGSGNLAEEVDSGLSTRVSARLNLLPPEQSSFGRSERQLLS